MKKILLGLSIAVFFCFLSISAADARSGCCSHHGGVCGCGCCDGSSLSATCAPYYPSCSKPAPAPVVKTTPKTNTVKTPVAPVVFTGKPKTYAQLYSCKVVGNYNSMIYHLKGSKYIKEMNLNNKECFASEAVAKAKGFRKSK
jgi:hypothetical protein